MSGAVALGACGPKQNPLPPPNINPEPTVAGHVALPLYGDSMSETSIVAHGRSVGTLFLLKKVGDKFQWSHECPVAVAYQWEPGDTKIRMTDLESEADIAAKFPVNPGFNFKAQFQAGKKVRIRVASPGSYHVDTRSLQVPRACKKDATHYVQVITVGAFTITSFSGTSGGASGGNAIGGASFDASETVLQGAESGQLWKCKEPAPNEPPDNCRNPVEVAIGELDGIATNDEPVEPGPTHPRPSPTTTPRPEASCYEAVKRTGDPEKDIVSVGAACGEKFGLAPQGDAFVRKLSQEQGWQRQFELEFQAGACYRIFAVGDNGIEDIDIGIKNSKGEQIAVDGQHGPVAVLNPDGPICAKVTENVVVLAKVEKGAGRYGFALWKKK